ncbi:MAG: hypothetical protein GXP17_01625 [Gammaproteobacteria bacterium]|nr:hypothetical protein [Gammaproteobacteria bacterium]
MPTSNGERRLLRIGQGKGGKNRLVTLPDGLLRQLRSYWRSCHPTGYLFPRYRSDRALSVSTAQKALPAEQAPGGGKKGRRHPQKRHMLYELAKSKTPARWSGKTRDWHPVGAVALNSEKEVIKK